MILVPFCVCEDARIWTRCICALDIRLNYLGQYTKHRSLPVFLHPEFPARCAVGGQLQWLLALGGRGGGGARAFLYIPTLDVKKSRYKESKWFAQAAKLNFSTRSLFIPESSSNQKIWLEVATMWFANLQRFTMWFKKPLSECKPQAAIC